MAPATPKGKTSAAQPSKAPTSQVASSSKPTEEDLMDESDNETEPGYSQKDVDDLKATARNREAQILEEQKRTVSLFVSDFSNIPS